MVGFNNVSCLAPILRGWYSGCGYFSRLAWGLLVAERIGDNDYYASIN